MSNQQSNEEYSHGPYEISRLKRMWETKKISLIQLAGQILRHIELLIGADRQQQADLARERRRINELEAEVNELRQIGQATRRQLERRLAALEEQ